MIEKCLLELLLVKYAFTANLPQENLVESHFYKIHCKYKYCSIKAVDVKQVYNKKNKSQLNKINNINYPANILECTKN